jgi:hypothetical protein
MIHVGQRSRSKGQGRIRQNFTTQPTPEAFSDSTQIIRVAQDSLDFIPGVAKTDMR